MSKLTEKINHYLLPALLLACLLFTVYMFFANLSFSGESKLAEKGEKINLQPYKALDYNFQAREDNLSAIRLRLETDKLARGDKIKVSVKSEDCSSVIREKGLGPLSLESNIFANFNFKKIPDSKNKFYCLEIAFITERGYTEIENYPYVYLSENPDFPGEKVTDAYSGKEYANYALVLKPAYEKGNAWENLKELDKRISQYKPWFLKKYYLAAVVFAFLILSLIIIFLLL